ncbi:MAG: SDR family oxidoreductase [Hyphomicrobiales bacterium]|nr:SDR family oxidoreductase [Hyphomicrobiales bacterium]
MIRRVSFIRRKAGLTREEFFAHWTGRHAEIVRRLPGLRGLRFSRVELCVPQDAGWDGVGETWFDSIDDANRAFATEPFFAMLTEDRAKFHRRRPFLLHRGAGRSRAGRRRKRAMSWNIAAGLEGKRVLVTGAAGGIGREVSLAFAAAEARVAAVDLTEETVKAVVDEMPGGPHMPLAIDLRPVAGHAKLIDGVVAALGGLDVLVCAAGVLVRRDSVDDVTEADWDFQHDINLKATFFLNQAAARVFRRQGQGGRIINFTSQGWWSGGFGGSVAYAASKGGVVSMTRGLARSLAKEGVTVNAVSPGAADTAMLRSGMTDEQMADTVAAIPLGRMASPSELAGAVLFLASEHASYVTGATINVSGGWLMY